MPLRVGEHRGVVLEEGLEEGVALVEAPDFEEEALEVRVVVICPLEWDQIGSDRHVLVGVLG